MTRGENDPILRIYVGVPRTDAKTELDSVNGYQRGGEVVNKPVKSPGARLKPGQRRPAGTQPTTANVSKSSNIVRKVLIAAITGALPDEYRDEAIDLLTDAMRGPDEDVRALAIIALQEMGGSAPIVLPALIEALHDPSDLVRRRATRALGDLGLAALPALSHLMSALQDSQNSVRMEAVAALGRMGSDAEPAIPTILGMLVEPELRLTIIARAALKRIGAIALPYLIGCLSDPNAILRERCALLLGQLGIADDQVIEALLESCTDDEADVRSAARKALDFLHQPACA